MKRFFASAAIGLFGLSACQGEVTGLDPGGGGLVNEEVLALYDGEELGLLLEGAGLFLLETFGGNGRTCAVCHSGLDGTVDPLEAQIRYLINPRDPLFRSIDSDDGQGNSFTRLLRDATIRVTVPLAPNVRLQDDPTATTVEVVRGIPTTNDMALNSILMWDARAPDLETQAISAVFDHYQPTDFPTPEEAEAIAFFEREVLFSSNALRKFAKEGKVPQLPQGRTPAEKRGREWFIEKEGVANCAICHSGPMLNVTSQFGQTINPPQARVPPGLPFFTAGVSELNPAGLPVRTYEITNPDGSVVTFQSPDLGLAARTGVPQLANFFKIPTLWNIKNTAPYFHDNSAKTLEDMMKHYDRFFQAFGLPPITPQEQADIIAFLKLL